MTAPTGATIASTPASKNPGRRAPQLGRLEMNQILYDNIYTCPSGTLHRQRSALRPYRPAAGKTGTVEAHLTPGSAATPQPHHLRLDGLPPG